MTKTTWDSQRYNTQHDYVARYGLEMMLSMLKPEKGERILDLGCGTGTLTQKIFDSGAQVIGIDSSAEMVHKAQKDYPQLELKVMDGQNFHFGQPFDAVFSNAALHWMLQPEKVIACVWNCLKDQGRFVFEMGAKGNLKNVLHATDQAAIELGLPSMPLANYYPSLAEYSRLLEAQGFRVNYAATIDRPTLLEGKEGLRNWIWMFRNNIVENMPENQQETFFKRVEELAQDKLFYHNSWWADYIRLRVVAIKNYN